MRSMKMAALAVAITLMCSGLALARDHNDHKYKDNHADRGHDSSHYNWRRGQDHVNQGRVNNDHHWWGNSREREHRNDGYYGGGQVYNRIPRSYPNGGYGYPNGGYGYPSAGGGYGYPSGGYGYPGGAGGYGYPTGGYGYPSGGYGNPGSVYGRGGYGNGAGGAGYNQGLQDGSYQARKDVAEGKPFNPYPRGSSHSDHGYHSSMGDKHVYQASYDQGYQSGYQSNYGGRGRRGWGF